MDELNEEAPRNGCHNCSNPEIEPGYQAPLCRDCRKKLSRYPVLTSVKLAAAGVLVLFLISGYNFPKYFKAGIIYEKAIKAEATHHYVTEKRLLEKVLQQFPDNFEASEHYIIAAFNNVELEEADSVIRLVAGRKSDNVELIDKTNNAIADFRYYMIADTAFAASLSRIPIDSPLYEQTLEKYCNNHPEDACANYILAKHTYNNDNFSRADSLLNKLLKSNPDFQVAKIMLSHSYRKEKKFEKALQLCEEVLQQNAESYYALASYAKILLAQQRNKEALQRAQQAYELNPHEVMTLGTLTLANHFNDNIKERDRLLKVLVSMPGSDSSSIADITGIINGKITYR
ncbi:tetratricopeptide repeat protein [Chitinophaga sp. RCC_12]|uniref:tetratricopeptide repeat protein n=1 Tax=Chitinophaga sp. RCC_12 TaxID=3239226 RepID=UPI003525BB9E